MINWGFSHLRCDEQIKNEKVKTGADKGQAPVKGTEVANTETERPRKPPHGTIFSLR
jgi:hypothetical protein